MTIREYLSYHNILYSEIKCGEVIYNKHHILKEKFNNDELNYFLDKCDEGMNTEDFCIRIWLFDNYWIDTELSYLVYHQPPIIPSYLK